MTINRRERVKDINKALERMKAKGHGNTIYYDRLKTKRDAIAAGSHYGVVEVLPFLIGYVGSLIPNCNFKIVDGDINKKVQVKPRGDAKASIKRFVDWMLQSGAHPNLKITKNTVKCLECGEVVTSIKDNGFLELDPSGQTLQLKDARGLVYCKCGSIAITGFNNYLSRSFADGKPKYKELVKIEIKRIEVFN